MSTTVTIRLPEKQYERTKAAAEADNRPISNFMETAMLRHIEQVDFCDEEEMKEIRADPKLIRSLKAGSRDYGKGRYTVVRNR